MQLSLVRQDGKRTILGEEECAFALVIPQTFLVPTVTVSVRKKSVYVAITILIEKDLMLVRLVSQEVTVQAEPSFFKVVKGPFPKIIQRVLSWPRLEEWRVMSP